MSEGHIRFTLSPFRPAWWLPGPHAHTVAGRFIRPLDREPPVRERIELPDGDFVDLHSTPGDLPDDAPTVVILHGLEGCYSSNYVATEAAELARLGIRAIRMNFRGCSGEMNRAPRFYHAGDTADLRHVLEILGRRTDPTRIGVVGFSLGGNVLLKFLGEQGSAAADFLGAAAAVSVPFDLAAGTRQLERPGMSWLYSLYFMRKLRRKARIKREVLVGHCDVDSAIRARTIRQYDDSLTAQIHGFEDAWHYYELSSSARLVNQIRVPTLILHALDDPFLPEASVPIDAIRENPWLIDGTTPEGGHVGFIGGKPWKPEFWAERQAALFFSDQLDEAEVTQSRLAIPNTEIENQLGRT